MKERRKKNDRRHYIAGKEGSPGNNRRRFPDRRLNSISVDGSPWGLPTPTRSRGACFDSPNAYSRLHNIFKFYIRIFT